MTFSPESWLAETGQAGASCWATLPFWDVIADLSNRLEKLSVGEDDEWVASGAIRRGYLAEFVQFASRICQPVSANLVSGIKTGSSATADMERWEWLRVDANSKELPETLLVMRARLGRLSDVYFRSAASLATRLSYEFKENASFREKYAGIRRLRVSGDMHMRGAVVILDSESRSVVYKPRSMRLDDVFSKLLAVLTEECGDCIPLHPESLDRGDYGWQDYVSYVSPPVGPERERFFTRFGSLIAIAYAFSMADLHFENIKCSGSSPLVIDAECLFHFPPYQALDPAATKASAGLLPLFRTGILPNWTKRMVNVDAIDESSLGAYPSDFRMAQRRTLVTDENGRPGYEYSPVPLAPKLENLPESHRGDFPAKGYEQAILSGYDQAGTALCRQSVKQKIIRILRDATDVSIRLVRRSTFDYVTELQSSSEFFPAQDSREQLQQWFEEREVEALSNGCVPVFERAFATPAIVSDLGAAHDASGAPMQLAIESMSRLTQHMFENQRCLVERSLQLAQDDCVAPEVGRTPLARSQEQSFKPRTMIDGLVEEIASSARWEGRHVWWPTATKLDKTHWMLGVTDDGVYDGLAGITLALGLVSRENSRAKNLFDRCHDSLLASIEHGLDESDFESGGLRNMSLSNGPVGGLLVVASLAELNSDQEMLRWVRGAGRTLTEHPSALVGWDYISGSAGTAIGMARLAEITEEPSFRTLTRQSLNSLAASVTKLVERKSLQAGLAHGLSGVAAAFAYAARQSGQADALHAAANCIAAEDLILSTVTADPRADQFGERYLSSSWCWGTAGQLQARLLAGIDGTRLMELHSRLVQERELPMNLCHGGLGTALLQASAEYRAYFGDDDVRRTNSRIDAVLANQGNHVTDWPPYASVPGLLTGTAGLLAYLASRRDEAAFCPLTLRYL